MSQITCNCGNIYDSGFKFCPECATPNPEYAKRQSADSQTPRPIKKKFTKVGESNLSRNSSEEERPSNPSATSQKPSTMQMKVTPKKNYTILKQNPVVPAKPIQQKQVQKKPVPQPEELFEEYEDEEEETFTPQEDDGYEDYDYEDEEESVADTTSGNYGEDEDYENEDEEEAETIHQSSISSTLPFKGKGKVLSAPSIKSSRNVTSRTVASMPKTKKLTQTKSSLGKSKPDYDPNHDGYYDDRLPAILDEVTKTSHMDVILKISLSAVCIAALITYCIFYVQI